MTNLLERTEGFSLIVREFQILLHYVNDFEDVHLSIMFHILSIFIIGELWTFRSSEAAFSSYTN